MSTLIVFQQMMVIVLLIAIGYLLYKTGKIKDEGSRAISFLVVNITNPAVAVSSAFSDELSISRQDLLTALAVILILYIVLILLGKLIPRLIGIRKAERKFYEMLWVYANVGFMGIPVVSAVIGPDAVLYASIFIVLFNVFFYTHGYATLLAGEGVSYRIGPKTFLNVGTISGVIAILVFWFRLRFPAVIENTISYAGRATTFLAMIVLGISLAKMPVKKLVEGGRMYLFWAIRYLALPLLAGLLLKQIFGSGLMAMTLTVLMAMPAANMPLILAEQYGINTEILSKGAFITTILSIVTVTLTTLIII